MDFYGVVYRITNLENDKCYIGRTKRPLHERWYAHCHRNSGCLRLRNAIQKYGKESFKIEAIASAWNAENLIGLEALLIEQENTLSPNGYNLRKDTGFGSPEMSKETRQRMSERRKGYVCSEEHRKNIGLAKKGLPSKMKGKRFSEEVRKNMGGQNKGKKASVELLEKLSKIRKGQKWYTDGISDCKFREGEIVPDGFRRGRSKGLDNLTMLVDLWKDPKYRQHMSDVHKKKNI